MFSRTTTATVPALALARPSGQVYDPPAVPPGYADLVAELGVPSPGIIRALLLEYFAEQGIRTYPLEKVEAYLTQVFGPGEEFKPAWGWAPLRQCDVGALVTHHFHNGAILHRAYREVVPMPVLHTVKQIVDQFPALPLHFYVSAEAKTHTGDPFIAVSAVGMPMLVFDVWDEPGFDRTGKE